MDDLHLLTDLWSSDVLGRDGDFNNWPAYKTPVNIAWSKSLIESISQTEAKHLLKEVWKF